MLDSGALVAIDARAGRRPMSSTASRRPRQRCGTRTPAVAGWPVGGFGGHAPACAPARHPGVPPILERVRRHPYVRLALDSSFSALWTGQLISALGDRIHQVALAFVVYDATRSAIAVGAIFLVATLPNLVFGAVAGTLVDRWDHAR
jgi:hypothetical protein